MESRERQKNHDQADDGEGRDQQGTGNFENEDRRRVNDRRLRGRGGGKLNGGLRLRRDGLGSRGCRGDEGHENGFVALDEPTRRRRAVQRKRWWDGSVGGGSATGSGARTSGRRRPRDKAPRARRAARARRRGFLEWLRRRPPGVGASTGGVSTGGASTGGVSTGGVSTGGGVSAILLQRGEFRAQLIERFLPVPQARMNRRGAAIRN